MHLMKSNQNDHKSKIKSKNQQIKKIFQNTYLKICNDYSFSWKRKDLSLLLEILMKRSVDFILTNEIMKLILSLDMSES